MEKTTKVNTTRPKFGQLYEVTIGNLRIPHLVMTEKKDKTEEMFQVMQFVPPKLKDNPRERSRITIHCKEQFGFLPETLIIDKQYGSNNRITISAVIPEKELSKKLKESKK